MHSYNIHYYQAIIAQIVTIMHYVSLIKEINEFLHPTTRS